MEQFGSFVFPNPLAGTSFSSMMKETSAEQKQIIPSFIRLLLTLEGPE